MNIIWQWIPYGTFRRNTSSFPKASYKYSQILTLLTTFNTFLLKAQRTVVVEGYHVRSEELRVHCCMVDCQPFTNVYIKIHLEAKLLRNIVLQLSKTANAELFL